MELPKRKQIRLPDYDYSQNGAYFVTVCTAYRKPILSKITHTVGRDDLGAPYVESYLMPFGKIVERYIRSISEAYPGVLVEKYCIMPNHIHLLLMVQTNELRRAGSSRPTQLLPRIITALKRFSNRDAGEKLWQAGYYEHIIRDENDFLARWQYIDQNPARWAEDEYYGEER